MKKILITGAKGFIGSNAVKYFKSLGYETFGIGHDSFSEKGSKIIELDHWKKEDISAKAILGFQQKFDVIIHCAGSGSVGFSLEHTNEDFKRTVDGTYEVLEYMREYNSHAHLIYPSSPAVQGEHLDQPIKESFTGKPASPYGYHKKLTEDLCQSYSSEFDINISIVRLFSVYGNGLKKQLLWDACKKIRSSKNEVRFWGTGEETRDFIHICDTLTLFDLLLKKKEKFVLINGGTGIRSTVRSIVELVRDLINPSIKISFDNQVNKGDPLYYWANMHKLESYGFRSKKDLKQEFKNYVEWVDSLDD